MSTDSYEAAREILDTLVMHTEFERVLAAADEMAEMVARTGVPAGILVTADPGMGKTALLKLIEARTRQRFATLSNNSPQIRLSFDAMVDLHKLAGAFLEALNYPAAPGRASFDVMTRMIDTALARMNTKLGCIDEAQHVCEGCRDITAHAVGDWLKRRMDRHQMMLVLMGTQTLGRMRQINAQFGSRVSADYVINTFTYGPAWHSLLRGLQANVKTVELGVIADKKVAKLVFDASIGNLRRLKQMIAKASYYTLNDGRKDLTLQDLSRGFDGAFGADAAVANPFRGQA